MCEKFCDHLAEFVKLEFELIQKHIDAHKWFHHIPNLDAGIKDFIEKYGWLMRELYCGQICEKRHECKVNKKT